MSRKQIYFRLFVHVLFYVLLVLTCIFLLPRFVVFFLPFIIGWLIAMIASPLVNFLEKHIKIKKYGPMIVIIGTIAVICGAIYGLCVMGIRELSGFIQDLPALYEDFKLQVIVLSDKLNAIIANIPFIAGDPSGDAAEFTQMLPEAFSDILGGVELPMLSTATNAFHGVANALLAVIMVFLSAYFFIVEKDTIRQKFSEMMPSFLKKPMDIIANSFIHAVAGYFRAQFKLAIVVFIVLYIGFKLIGVKYSFLLGVVVAFLDLLPVFGTGFVIWPWAVVDLILGNYMEMVILIVIYLLCQLIKQLLQPKMVGDSIGMNPLATLIFLYSGYKMGGFLGMLIGIPVGMILVNFYQAGLFDVLIEDLKNVSKDLVENYWN